MNGVLGLHTDMNVASLDFDMATQLLMFTQMQLYTKTEVGTSPVFQVTMLTACTDGWRVLPFLFFTPRWGTINVIQL